MSSETQKANRERFLLDQFLKQQSLTPTNIEQLRPPAPDFSIEVNGHRVGLELTEIFIQDRRTKPHPHNSGGLRLQEIDSLTQKIVSEAQDIYSARGANPPVRVQIVFANLQFGRERRSEIARMIARRVELMVLEDSPAKHWRPDVLPWEWNDSYESISSIYVHKVPDMHLAKWKSPSHSVGLVSALTIEGLQERIDHKTKKLQAYKEKLDEIWLLIVADRTRPPQMLQRLPSLQTDLIANPFDKTFYYCYGTDEPVLEIGRTAA